MTPDRTRPVKPPNAFPERLCKFCQKKFTPKRKWQLFCSDKHRNAYWNIQYILDGDNNESHK